MTGNRGLFGSGVALFLLCAFQLAPVGVHCKLEGECDLHGCFQFARKEKSHSLLPGPHLSFEDCLFAPEFPPVFFLLQLSATGDARV